MNESIVELFHHLLRLTALSFFMVLPGLPENAAMAEHAGGFKSKTFGDSIGSYARPADVCGVGSATTNIADPVFATATNPTPPTQVIPTTPPAKPDVVAAKGQSAIDAGKILFQKCVACHSQPGKPKLTEKSWEQKAKSVEKRKMPKGNPWSEDELSQVLAYLESEKKPSTDTVAAAK